MPNIVIVGFGKSTPGVEHLVKLLIKELLGEEIAQKSVTTPLHSMVRTCGDGCLAPYLIVRDNNLERANQVAKFLNERMELDIEIEEIQFIQGNFDDLKDRLDAWLWSYEHHAVPRTDEL